MHWPAGIVGEVCKAEGEEGDGGEDGLPGEGGRGAVLALAAGLARLYELRLRHISKPAHNNIILKMTGHIWYEITF